MWVLWTVVTIVAGYLLGNLNGIIGHPLGMTLSILVFGFNAVDECLDQMRPGIFRIQI